MQGDEAREGRGTAITVLLPDLLPIVLGLTMAAVGAGLGARNQRVGLLLLVVGLGGPVFEVRRTFGRLNGSEADRN